MPEEAQIVASLVSVMRSKYLPQGTECVFSEPTQLVISVCNLYSLWDYMQQWGGLQYPE